MKRNNQKRQSNETHTDCAQIDCNEEKSGKPTVGGRWKKILKISLWSIAGLVLSAVIAIIIYWNCIGVTTFDEGMASLKRLFTPRSNDVYFKDSYTVTDEEAQEEREQIVASAGGKELNNGTLQVYYWMGVLDFLENNSYYAMYEGLDYALPLDQQTYGKTGGTWQQYFLDRALNEWHCYQTMALLALEEGIVKQSDLDQTRENLRVDMAQAALEGGYSSLDAMIRDEIGPGCTFTDYSNYFVIYYAGYSYFTEKYGKLEISDAEIESWFTENTAQLQEQGINRESGDLMDVRHILIAVEGGTEDENGDIIFSDEEWEDCRKEAQEVLDLWLSGDATEESFAQLANERSEDMGSNENGGLYEGLNADSGFVQEFTDWYMDESRQVGDYGLIRTTYGYHVMYFSGSEPQWIRAAREGLEVERSVEIQETATRRYPMEVNYKKIVLGETDLSLS